MPRRTALGAVHAAKRELGAYPRERVRAAAAAAAANIQIRGGVEGLGEGRRRREEGMLHTRRRVRTGNKLSKSRLSSSGFT